MGKKTKGPTCECVSTEGKYSCGEPPTIETSVRGGRLEGGGGQLQGLCSFDQEARWMHDNI